MIITVPISVGELIDKITILTIKSERITDPAKLTNVFNELSALEAIARTNGLVDTSHYMHLFAKLKRINGDLWHLEDEVRRLMKEEKFDDEYIRVTSNIHHTNDARARVKGDCNRIYNSSIVDEKSYKELK